MLHCVYCVSGRFLDNSEVASPVSLERDQDEVTCRISGDDTHNKLHDTSPEAEARSEARSGDRGPSDESSEPEEKGRKQC